MPLCSLGPVLGCVQRVLPCAVRVLPSEVEDRSFCFLNCHLAATTSNSTRQVMIRQCREVEDAVRPGIALLGPVWGSDLNLADVQVWLARSETATPATGAVLDRGRNLGSAAF